MGDVNLIIVEGPGLGATFPVKEDRVKVIGRGEEADYKLLVPAISRRHCEIRHDDGSLWVKDLDSRGGTFVNGEQVSEYRLNPGDKLRLGPVVFLVHAVDATTADSNGEELTVEDDRPTRLANETALPSDYGLAALPAKPSAPDTNLEVPTQVVERPGLEAPDAERYDETLFGKIAVREGYLNESELAEAITRQNDGEVLGECLVREGWLTERQLDDVLRLQEYQVVEFADRKLGRLAVRNGFLTDNELGEVVERQHTLFREGGTVPRLGEMLIQEGYLRELELNALLKNQTRLQRSASSSKRRRPVSSRRAAVVAAPMWKSPALISVAALVVVAAVTGIVWRTLGASAVNDHSSPSRATAAPIATNEDVQPGALTSTQRRSAPTIRIGDGSDLQRQQAPARSLPMVVASPSPMSADPAAIVATPDREIPAATAPELPEPANTTAPPGPDHLATSTDSVAPTPSASDETPTPQPLDDAATVPTVEPPRSAATPAPSDADRSAQSLWGLWSQRALFERTLDRVVWDRYDERGQYLAEQELWRYHEGLIRTKTLWNARSPAESIEWRLHYDDQERLVIEECVLDGEVLETIRSRYLADGRLHSRGVEDEYGVETDFQRWFYTKEGSGALTALVFDRAARIRFQCVVDADGTQLSRGIQGGLPQTRAQWRYESAEKPAAGLVPWDCLRQFGYQRAPREDRLFVQRPVRIIDPQEDRDAEISYAEGLPDTLTEHQRARRYRFHFEGGACREVELFDEQGIRREHWTIHPR